MSLPPGSGSFENVRTADRGGAGFTHRRFSSHPSHATEAGMSSLPSPHALSEASNAGSGLPAALEVEHDPEHRQLSFDVQLLDGFPRPDGSHASLVSIGSGSHRNSQQSPRSRGSVDD